MTLARKVYVASKYKYQVTKYRHYCHDWDGLEIDENDPEFISCTCYWNYDNQEEIREIKKKLEDKEYERYLRGEGANLWEVMK